MKKPAVIEKHRHSLSGRVRSSFYAIGPARETLGEAFTDAEAFARRPRRITRRRKFPMRSIAAILLALFYWLTRRPRPTRATRLNITAGPERPLPRRNA